MKITVDLEDLVQEFDEELVAVIVEKAVDRLYREFLWGKFKDVTNELLLTEIETQKVKFRERLEKFIKETDDGSNKSN